MLVSFHYEDVFEIIMNILLLLNNQHQWQIHDIGVSCCLRRVNMNHIMRTPIMWFLTRSDTNLPVQSQKKARGLNFW